MLDNSTAIEGQLPNDNEEDSNPTKTEEIANSMFSGKKVPILSAEMAEKIINAVSKTRDNVNNTIDFVFHFYFEFLGWYIIEEMAAFKARTEKSKKESHISLLMVSIREAMLLAGETPPSDDELRETAEQAIQEGEEEVACGRRRQLREEEVAREQKAERKAEQERQAREVEAEKERQILSLMDKIREAIEGGGGIIIEEGEQGGEKEGMFSLEALREAAEDMFKKIELGLEAEEERKREMKEKRKLATKGQRYPVAMPGASMTTPQSKSNNRKRKQPPRRSKGFKRGGH